MISSRTALVHLIRPPAEFSLAEIRARMLDIGLLFEGPLGYSQPEIQNGVLTATLVKRSVTRIQQYDAVAQAMAEEEIEVFSQVEFAFDEGLGLLEVFGAASGGGKVRAAMRSLLGPGLVLEAVEQSIRKCVARLAMRFHGVRVDRLSITDFLHEEGVRGRFEVSALTPAFAEEALAQSEQDVTRGQLSLYGPDTGEFGLVLSNHGYVRIVGEEANLDACYDAVKFALFSGLEPTET